MLHDSGGVRIKSECTVTDKPAALMIVEAVVYVSSEQTLFAIVVVTVCSKHVAGGTATAIIWNGVSLTMVANVVVT